jgi:hypothetical protein
VAGIVIVLIGIPKEVAQGEVAPQVNAAGLEDGLRWHLLQWQASRGVGFSKAAPYVNHQTGFFHCRTAP